MTLRRPAYKWIAFTAVGAFFITAVLAMTMVFVALPAMAAEFDITLKQASWIPITWSLTISALLLPMGRLSDLVGRRRVLLVGLALFGVGAAMCALAPTFAWLLVGRVVLSVGGALGESVGTGILVSVFPPEERGKAVGSQTSAVAVGAAAAPLAAGLAIELLSWRALFWLIAGMSAFSFVLAAVVLDENRVTPPERAGAGAGAGAASDRARFDGVGAALSIVAVVAFVVTLNNPFDLAWGSWPMLASAAMVAVALTAFIRWELRCPHPMLELSYFADRTFSKAVASRVLGFVANGTVYLLIPVLLVAVAGWGEGRAGIPIFLHSVGLGVAAQAAGRLSDRWGARGFMLGGYVASAVLCVALSAMDAATPLRTVSVVALLIGLATGSWNVTGNATVISTVPRSAYGVVGAFTNLARNVGNVVGQALVAVIVTVVMVARGFDIALDDIGTTPGAGPAFVAGWRVTFLVMAAVLLAAAAVTVTLKPSPREVPVEV